MMITFQTRSLPECSVCDEIFCFLFGLLGSNVSSNNAGMGRGRGRGLLINHPESVEVHTQNSTNWSFQGRGRGRRRRRSSSGSPNPSSGTERKKTKEGLLERVPDFGTGLRGEGWAKELLKNLKVTWEADHKRKLKMGLHKLQINGNGRW